GARGGSRPGRLGSGRARSAVTPPISPLSFFCARTELPRLMAARNLPVGARSFTTSGGTVLMDPLWVLSWANDAAVAARRMTADQMNRTMLPLLAGGLRLQ